MHLISVESPHASVQSASVREGEMKLPGRDAVVVSERKVRAYLLSRTHVVGRYKAAWLEAFGFSAAAWAKLAEALETHAAACEVAGLERSPFGVRYVVEGPLVTPDGRNPSARSVWFIEDGSDRPQFFTLYPIRRGQP